MDIINYLLPKIEHFRMLGYWVVLFVSLLESLAFVGLLVPGSVFMVVVGSLAAGGYFDLGDLIWFAAAGAVLGDGISFILGRRGHILFSDSNRIFKASYLEKGREFFDRHGGKSVFFGRFIGFARPVVPFVAGMSHMEVRKFYLWNVASALLWAPAVLLPGYFFGHAWRVIEIWSSRAGIFLAVLVLLLVGIHLLKRLVLKRGKQLAAFIGPILVSVGQAIVTEPHVRRLVADHPRFFTFIKQRLDRSEFSGLPLTLLSLAFFYVLLLLFGVVEDLLTLDPIVAVDTHLANLLYVYRSPGLVHTFLWITLLGKAKIVLTLAAAASLIAWLRNKRAFILPLWITVAGSGLFSLLGKVAFHRQRPPGIGVYTEASFSFPSGHATIATAFYGFIVYYLWRQADSRRARLNILFTGGVFILAIGFSRLYLVVHFLSDVLGGYLLGFLWLIIGICMVEWRLFAKTEAQVKALSLFSVKMASAALILAELVFYIHTGLHYNPARHDTEISGAIKLVGADIISDFNRYQLPRSTESITGEQQEPLNIIIVAKDSVALSDSFKAAGWQPADPVTIGTVARTIKAQLGNESYPTAPITPSFWNGNVNDLGFEKPTSAHTVRQRHHARLWKTGLTTTDNRRVFVGTTSLDAGMKWWGLTHKIKQDIDTERDALLNDLLSGKHAINYTKTRFVEPVSGHNFAGDLFFTDGYLYVVFMD